MKFVVAADTDIGISKTTNQDSVCVKTAETRFGTVSLTLICDGMGGLSKGELASATVIRSFSEWFENDIPEELENWNWENISFITERRLKDLNMKILNYGSEHNVQMGTTVSGMITLGMKYMLFHIGDTRIYKISDRVEQLTKDHTFISREIERGTMTLEEAMKDHRRNALLQCVGASRTVVPEIKFGELENKANYMFCSDGFRHVLSNEEIFKYLSPSAVKTKMQMQKNMRYMIEIVKSRKEKDNISVIMIRPEA